MLYSVILGNLENSEINNNWTLANDDYNNTFITNVSIRQKIRLGKNVEKKLNEIKNNSQNTAIYKIAKNTFLSNNNKNMNLSLMNFWSSDENIRKEHIDDNVLYVTFLNKDYSLLDYTSYDNEVIQTYRQKDVYQGLAISFKDTKEYKFSMYLYDILNKRYVDVDVFFDNDGKFNVKTEIDPSSAGRLKKNKKPMHFKMNIKRFPTNTFLVNKKYEEEMINQTSNIPNVNIITIDGEIKDLRDNNSLHKLFTESIVNNRVRAITTVGVKLPKTFCRTYNILYLFDYDIESEWIKCIKSN